MDKMLLQHPTSNFYNPSLALQERKVLIYDVINRDSILNALHILDGIVGYDNRFNKPKNNIEIQISSVGGEAEDGFTLISTIEQLKKEGYNIITTNIGRAYSMGFLISICGSLRRCYKYSQYMYHDVSYEAVGKHYDILDSIEYCSFYRESVLDIVSKYTSLTKEEIENINKMRKDKFFTPKNMLDIKGVDIIV